MGTGYTRNDTVNNIADGNIINASDLDGEFDAVQAAFDAATGHTHDGTTGEGAPIEVTGPAQEYVSTNTELRPKANNTYDLGSAANQWKDLYVDGTANLDAVDIDGGNIDGTTIGAATPAAGTFTTTTATTGNITTVNATTVDTTNIEVTNIKAKDGTSAGSIADATGVVTLASSVLTTTDINGGTIDGATIGGASAAAGTFTTATATTGNITTVNATTVDSTNVEVTNIKAKDGTASATIADSTGVMTVASSVLTTTDINGGTADNVVIGGATPAAGTFTTLTANGNVVLGDAATDTVTITADVASNIIPSADNTYDLGASGSEWKDLYIDGTANIDSLVADTADINGGTIDGTVIGGSTPAAISGTTGSFSGNLTVDTNTLFVDAANNRVGVGTSSPESALHIASASGNAQLRVITGDTTSVSQLIFGDSADSNTGGLQYNHSDDSLQFHVGNIGEKMRLDSSGNVGIGTSSPSRPLHVIGNTRVEAAGTAFVSAAMANTNGGTDEKNIDWLNNSTIFSLRLLNDASNAARTAYDVQRSGYTPTIHRWFTAASGNPSERMRIDSSGKVGIGTSSPSKALDVVGEITASSSITSGGNIFADSGKLRSSDGTAAQPSIMPGVDNDTGFFRPATNTIGFSTVGTERMRIDSSGYVLVGQTAKTSSVTYGGVYISGDISVGATNDYAQVFVQHNSNTNHGIVIKELQASGPQIIFLNSSDSEVGSITTTSSATAYNTSSDYRLKEDVQPMVGASGRLMALNPVNFAWKVDGSRVDGFLAHEAQEVVPEAVTGEKDGEQMQAIDHSKLVPLLTAALQEALQKIEALEARLNALEGQ